MSPGQHGDEQLFENVVLSDNDLLDLRLEFFIGVHEGLSHFFVVFGLLGGTHGRIWVSWIDNQARYSPSPILDWLRNQTSMESVFRFVAENRSYPRNQVDQVAIKKTIKNEKTL